MNTNRPLRRSRDNRWFAGVIGGLAEHFGLSANALRLIYVIVSIASAAFPGILIYLVLWLVIPMEEA